MGWVNASGGSFDNTFQKGGQRVNWYVGGKRPTTESPIVKRLLNATRGLAPEKKTLVHLFVRPRATEPYINCGVCKYAGHDPKKTGFEFTWQLRDFAALSKATAFRQMVEAQKGSPHGCAIDVAARWA